MLLLQASILTTVATTSHSKPHNIVFGSHVRHMVCKSVARGSATSEEGELLGVIPAARLCFSAYLGGQLLWNKSMFDVVWRGVEIGYLGGSCRNFEAASKLHVKILQSELSPAC